ncbi:6-pyruvoyl trahydropterin synthase family protein [Nonomuraea sp. NPDC003214]
MFTTSVSHAFDAAHRLPHLGGKCVNLHGHTWHTTVTIGTGHLDREGVVVDFSRIKKRMRAWIDDRLDHATMLGADDRLLPALQDEAQKVFIFGRSPGTDYPDQPWPTVEAVAQLLADQAHDWLRQAADRVDVTLLRVDVAETATNTASWHAAPYRPTIHV